MIYSICSPAFWIEIHIRYALSYRMVIYIANKLNKQSTSNSIWWMVVPWIRNIELHKLRLWCWIYHRSRYFWLYWPLKRCLMFFTVAITQVIQVIFTEIWPILDNNLLELKSQKQKLQRWQRFLLACENNVFLIFCSLLVNDGRIYASSIPSLFNYQL